MCSIECPSIIIYSVPLCYVYLAMLHYKARAHTRKMADIAMILFGLAATAYTMMQASEFVPFSFVTSLLVNIFHS